MCESVVCGLHYGLHSIFKHTNQLYYCNCRCIGGMICCISKLYNLNLIFRYYFALLMTNTEFLTLLFGTASLSIVYTKFCTNVFEKVIFC